MVDGIINLKTTINEWRSARELRARKLRGSSYLQGVHSYDINQDGFTVYPRLETLISPVTDVNGELRRISSGIPGSMKRRAAAYPRAHPRC